MNTSTSAVAVANTTFIPRGGATLAGIYHVAVLCYLTSLLFLYPYGIPLSPEVSLRMPDLLALPTLMIGATAILFRTQIRIDRTLLTVVGFFLLMELYLPIVGAAGYRRPVDVLSSVRMAMLWLPMIFLFETGWYAVVAIVFSSEGPRSSYLGGKIWLDRLAAGILGLLGVKLISEAR